MLLKLNIFIKRIQNVYDICRHGVWSPSLKTEAKCMLFLITKVFIAENDIL